MPSLFISHSSRDKTFVRDLKYYLGDFDIHVWVDEDQIQAGDSLIGKIESAIDEMDSLAVVLTPASVKSRWVKEELEQALTKRINDAGVTVLPLLLRTCQIPGFLKGKKYIDCRAWKKEQAFSHMRGICQQIARAMGVDPHGCELFSGQRVLLVKDFVRRIHDHFAPRKVVVQPSDHGYGIDYVRVQNPDGTLEVYGDLTRPSLLDLYQEILGNKKLGPIIGVEFTDNLFWDAKQLREREKLITDWCQKKRKKPENFWRAYRNEEGAATKAYNELISLYKEWLYENSLVIVIHEGHFGTAKSRK